ncbi:MAG: RloB family protein [Bacteroidota bacterium]
MPRKNRAYKKGEPHRDARLFVIVAEGEREDAYFRFFNAINQRVKIKIVAREGGKSAPKYFLDRVAGFRESEEWIPAADDQLWFVLDVDRWSRTDIDELYQQCAEEQNWNITISNPCFEVWLLYHRLEAIDVETTSCQALKTRLDQLTPGGYTLETDARLLTNATQNALAADSHPDHYFPEIHESKLYRLGEQLLTLLGQNWLS